MEFKIYNNYSSSILDKGRDVNIGETRWDKLFESLVQNTELVYFAGNRKLFVDEEFLLIRNSICEKLLLDVHNSFTLFFKIFDASILVSRKLLSAFFEYYEFPAIFFLKDVGFEHELVKQVRLGENYEVIVSKFNGIYAFSNSFEKGVVWLYKSSDMEFPEI